jgi:hypothetical protein
VEPVEDSSGPAGPQPWDGYLGLAANRALRVGARNVDVSDGVVKEIPLQSQDPEDYEYLLEGKTGQARKQCRAVIKNMLRMGIQPTLDPQERALRGYAAEVHGLVGAIPIQEIRRVVGQGGLRVQRRQFGAVRDHNRAVG